jgi:hypothetical protein
VALTATIAVQPWRLCTTHVFFGSPRRDGLESRTHLVRPPSSAARFRKRRENLAAVYPPPRSTAPGLYPWNPLDLTKQAGFFGMTIAVAHGALRAATLRRHAMCAQCGCRADLIARSFATLSRSIATRAHRPTGGREDVVGCRLGPGSG